MLLKIKTNNAIIKTYDIRGVKDFVVYPDGDVNTKAYVSIEYIVKKGERRRFESLYEKPISVVCLPE